LILELELRLKLGPFVLEIDQRLEGPVQGLFGPSGSGKTTLLKLICGLASADSGRIVLDGDALWDHGQRINVLPSRRRIGMVFQEDRLFPHMTVRENLAYGGHPRGRQPGVVGTEWTLDRVAGLLQLEGLLDKRPTVLSGGEKQRVALGRTILSGPRLLLLDEPLSSLDAGLKREILPFLRAVRDKTRIPMIYVSHDLPEVLDLTPKLLLIDKGRIVAGGPFMDLVQAPEALRVLRIPGLVNVLRLRLRRTDIEEGISTFEAVEGNPAGSIDETDPIYGPSVEGAIASEIHAVLRPEDVALATTPPSGLSMQNRLRGRIRRFVSQGNSVLCLIDARPNLIAEISPHAVRQLRLEEGSPVYCLFKAFALRYLDR
jgi:molybdate transport system ATP-binding protein